MTAKEKVLAVHPDAVWVPQYGAIYDDSETSRERLSGSTWWNDEEAAWQNAAESLPAAPEPFIDRECVVCGFTWYENYKDETCPSCDNRKRSPVAPVEAKEKERFPDNFSEAAAFAGITSCQGCQFHMYLQHLLGNGPKPGFLVAEPKPTPSELTITVPRDIAHGLWCAGGKLRSDLSASLVLSPENWHEEGLRQQLDKWDAAAERYFDFAISGKSQPDSSSIPDLELIERIAVYMESESECLMQIVPEETKRDYGVRLLKVMADEIREKFAAKGQSNDPV